MLLHLSIRRKLTLLLVGNVGLVLLAVAVVLIVTDVHATRERLAERYSTLATVVAANSAAALSFADIDPSSAQQVIFDINVERNIVFAALYDLQGREIAHYQSVRLSAGPSTPPREVGPQYTEDGFLDVVQPVRQNDGQVIGRIYLRVSLDSLHAQTQRQMSLMALLFVAALGFAGLLSIVLQRLISNPILSLAEVASRVSHEHNYALRAHKTSHDELGTLCDGFNAMLTVIQQRDAVLQETVRQLKSAEQDLRQAQNELEERVRVRTAELERANRALQSEVGVRERAEQTLRQSTAELEQFNRLAVGREQRMIELKREINEHARQSGEPEPYDLSFLEQEQATS